MLSSVYILASIALLIFGAGGLHAHASWALESTGAFVLLSVLTGWLPLRYALQRLEDIEV